MNKVEGPFLLYISENNRNINCGKTVRLSTYLLTR